MQAPLWVTLAPPWPVIRLACRIKGKSPALALLGMPLALLASADADYPDSQAIDRTAGAEPRSRPARPTAHGYSMAAIATASSPSGRSSRRSFSRAGGNT